MSITKRILVDGVTPTDYGIWSPGLRGDHRWAASTARLFKKLGWDVDIPLSDAIVEGYENRQCGINWAHPLRSSYDLFFAPTPAFRMPSYWETMSLKCKKGLFGTFWHGGNYNPPANCMMVTPYRELPVAPDMKIIPHLFIDKFGESKFHNKTLVFVDRTLIFRHNGPHTPASGMDPVNLLFLKTALKAAKQGHKVMFLSFVPDLVFGNASVVETVEHIIEAQKILRELQTMPNVEFHGTCPQDKFEELMKMGSVAVRSFQSASPSGLSLLHGLVPTMFTYLAHPVFLREKNIPGIEFFSEIKSEENFLTEEIVEERIFRLLTDEAFYNEQLALLRANTSVFTTDEALVKLQKVLDILGA
jgi:hypothetical protein